MARFDAAVIGSGVYGLLTALKLDAKGMSVLLLDRYAPGHRDAGSSGLTRAAHTLYDDPVYTGLAVQSLGAYREMRPDAIADCDAVLFAERRDDETHASKVIKAQAAHHAEFSGDAFPSFKADYGCRDALGGVFRMEIIREHLLGALARSSVQCAFHNDVHAIRINGNDCDIQYGDNETASVATLVIAAGCGSQEVLNMVQGIALLDLTLDMVKPGTLMHFKPRDATQAERASHRNMPAFAYIERGIFGLPIVDGYTDSVKIAGYFDPAADTRMGEDTLPFLKTHIPFLLDFEIATPRVVDECRYDYTKDGHFIVGPLGSHPNLVLACGWNGGGYKFAPAITDLIAQYVCSDRNAIPEGFSPMRLYK